MAPPSRLRSNARLVFDLDDTLYLERDYIASGFAACGRLAQSLWGAARFEELCLGELEGGRRGDIFNVVLEALAIEPTPQRIERLVAEYRDHQPSIRLCPDAAHFLTKIAGRFPTGLISDGFESAQRRKLEALGPAIDAPILTDSYGREFWKPHPRAFETVEKSLGGGKEQFVYFGDNPCKDFQAPRDCGWRTVRVRRSGGLHAAIETEDGAAADFEISSFDQLALA